MTVVVTGARGFLGRSVVRRLEARGVDVVAISRRDAPGCIRVVDYSDAPVGDALIHLAEDPDRRRVNAADSSYEKARAATLARLVDKSYDRIVYASSAAVYGDSVAAPRRPDEEISPEDAYTRGKRLGELAVLSRGRGVAARLSNVYGPSMSADTVINAVMRQIPGAGAVTLEDLHPVRDFLWVDDAAEGLAAMAAGGPSGVFNLGTGVGTSIGAVARLALAVAGQDDREVIGLTSHRASSLVLDISATIAAWPWRPATSLREGLTLMLAGNRSV